MHNQVSSNSQAVLSRLGVALTGENLVVMYDGTLWGSGFNRHGQLGGVSTYTPPASQPSRPRFQPFSQNGVDSFACSLFTTFIISRGFTWGTGRNNAGQVGASRDPEVRSFMYSSPGPDNSAVEVAPGPAHTLVVSEDGSLWAAGSNTSRQLGLPVPAVQGRFTKVPFGGQVTHAAAGDELSVVSTVDGRLFVSGRVERFGSTQEPFREFTEVSDPGRPVVSLAAGRNHVLAVRDDGSLWVWGSNLLDQLGVPGVPFVDRAVRIDCGLEFASAHAGGDQSFAVTVDGRLAACGRAPYRSHGWGSGLSSHYRPNGVFTVVPTPGVVLSVAATDTNTALVTDQGLFVAGQDACERLGLNETPRYGRFTPVAGDLRGSLLDRLAADVGADVAVADLLAADWDGSLVELFDMASAVLTHPA
jgi:hypothetical protein